MYFGSYKVFQSNHCSPWISLPAQRIYRGGNGREANDSPLEKNSLWIHDKSIIYYEFLDLLQSRTNTIRLLQLHELFPTTKVSSNLAKQWLTKLAFPPMSSIGFTNHKRCYGEEDKGCEGRTSGAKHILENHNANRPIKGPESPVVTKHISVLL